MKKILFGLAALAGLAGGAYLLAKKLGGEGCPFCAHNEEEDEKAGQAIPFDNYEGECDECAAPEEPEEGVKEDKE